MNSPFVWKGMSYARPEPPGDAAEQFGNWVKACCGDDRAQAWLARRSIPLTKVHNEAVDSAGGYLLPEIVESAIVALRERYGAFRQGADVRSATTAVTVRPRRVGGASAYWTPEGSAITESSLSWDAVTAPSQKLAVLCRFSSELLSDSAPDLGAYLSQELAFAFSLQEDTAGFVGTGISTSGRFIGLKARLTGTSGSVSTAGHSTFVSCDSTDIANTIAVCTGPAQMDGAFYMSPAAYASVFCRLAGSTGGVAMTAAGPSYLGFPVRLSGALPTSASVGEAMFYYGSLARASSLYDRSPMVLAFSRDRSLEYDQVLCRGTSRLSIVNHDAPGSMAMFIGAS